LLLISLTLIFCVSNVSAASEVYVNTTGNDSGSGTAENPFLTLQKGVDNVDPNGIIHIGNGQYSGLNNTNITISQNMTIIGESQSGTIINGTDTNWLFNVTSNVNFHITNLTLTNGKMTNGFYGGGAVLNSGNLTAKNCTFTSNTAPVGGAIFNDGRVYDDSGSLTCILTDCTFTSNRATDLDGGAIHTFSRVYGGSCLVNLSITNCTFTNNTAINRGNALAIEFDIGIDGSTTGIVILNSIITGCNFTNHTDLFGKGGAIYNDCHVSHGSGTFNSTITESNFTDNAVTYADGGAIYNNCYASDNSAIATFTSTVDNCNFTNNSAGASYYYGGAIYNECGGGGNPSQNSVCSLDSTITNSNFTGNTAAWGGAIYNKRWTNSGFGSSLSNTITGCNFTSNAADTQGGAICNHGSNCEVHFNRIFGNTSPTGTAIYNANWLTATGSMNVTNNWWGTNNPAFNSLIAGPVPVDNSTWLYMTINATPSTINNTETSLVTVSFNNHYNGTTVTPYTPGVGEYIPNGIPVTFSLIEDIFGPHGTLTGPLTVGTSNGIASILFTASRAGIQEINASTDDENITATVTINPASYVAIEKEFMDLPWGNVINTAYYNDKIYAIVKVNNQGPDETSINVLDILNGLTWTGNYYVYRTPGSYPNTDTAWVFNDPDYPFNGTDWDVGSLLTLIGSSRWLAIEVTVNQTGTVSNYAETYDQITSPYKGYANYTAFLTSDIAPTIVTVDNVRGDKGDTVTLRAVLSDYLGNALAGDTVEFWIDGVNVGGNTTDNTGTALFNYIITQTPGNHPLKALFNETPLYVGCNATGTLYIPTSDLYIQITSNKNNPKVGETFTLTYKLGNNGPDDATNVTITIPIPEGFHISSITGDGTWNIVGNNIIWTFNNVTVGDPYLYITGWTTAAGNYIFTASINSNTFNLNSRGVNSLSINAQPQVNTATTNTIGMQNTGTPIAGIILAILMVLGGLIGTHKKQ
jgi:uncharacterized repeat protein (TIGR01451 family)